MKASDNKNCIATQLNLWHQGKYDALIQDITATSLASAGYRSITNDDEKVEQKYHSTILDGRLYAAVCGLASCNSGGILGLDDACTKAGCHIWEVLVEKHRSLHTPNLLDPYNLAFADHSMAPDIMPIDCPQGDAEQVLCHLQGSTGCSRVDAEHLKNQLLKHGKALAELHEELLE